MSGNNDIRYLTHDQVDKSKWDHCIHTAANGLIYATSFYLDHMATHWDALVLNDYEAVMPLTWNRKYGIKYLFQPFLTAQLGVFGNQLTSTLTGAFIKAIPTSFRYIDISLNSGNHLPPKTGRTILRKNYLLDLSKPYEELTTGYNENTRRNVKKAAQARCRIEKGFEVERVIQLAIQQMRSYGRESKENTDRFSKLYHSLSVNRMAVTYGVIRENELLASCVFFFSHNRAYYILVGNRRGRGRCLVGNVRPARRIAPGVRSRQKRRTGDALRHSDRPNLVRSRQRNYFQRYSRARHHRPAPLQHVVSFGRAFQGRTQHQADRHPHLPDERLRPGV